MQNDTVVEIARALIAGYVLFYLLLKHDTKQLRKIDGWYYIVTGFVLIFFGMIIDITDNFESLNKYVIIGNTRYEAILEKVDGYLFGLIFLAIGFSKWLPKVIKYNNKISNELNDAVKELNSINELLHICSSCKKISDNNGKWVQIETYMKDHAKAKFSHGMCPKCVKELYPDLDFSELDTEKS